MNDLPVEIKITFIDSSEKTIMGDVVAHLDPMGTWLGVFIDGDPVFTIPQTNVKFVEFIYHDKEEEKSYTH